MRCYLTSLEVPYRFHGTGVPMHTTLQLLDAAKANSGLSSDYKLGIVLGLTSDSAVTNYRKGRSHPDDKIGRRLADLAGLDEGYVLACLHAERAKDDESRQVWQRIAKRLESVAASLLAVLVLGVGLIVSPDASAMAKSPSPAPMASNCSACVYYVNRLKHALIGRCLAAFSRILRPCPCPSLAA